MNELPVPPEFRGQLLSRPKRREGPEEVEALAAFAHQLARELGDTPQLYLVNRARLALADRYELLRRGTPMRSRRQLMEAFHQHYAVLFDRSLSLQVPELSPPPVPETVPLPPPPPRPRSVAEALALALEQQV